MVLLREARMVLPGELVWCTTRETWVVAKKLVRLYDKPNQRNRWYFQAGSMQDTTWPFFWLHIGNAERSPSAQMLEVQRERQGRKTARIRCSEFNVRTGGEGP